MALGIFGRVEPSTKRQGLFRMPDGPGHFFAREGAGKAGSTRRYGQKNLIAFLMLLIDAWHRKHPTYPLPLGDMAEEDGSHQKDHKTHDEGFAVDIFNLHLLPGRHKGPAFQPAGDQNPFYGRAMTTELGHEIAAMKPVFSMMVLYHNDPQLRQAVNKQSTFRPPFTEFHNHEDHIHVSLREPTTLTPAEINAILGLDKFKKLIEQALGELIATGQMLAYGARSHLVKALQTVLNAIAQEKGTQLAPLAADGIFGQKTKGRVQEFQGQHRLAQDGIVGPKTKQALSHSV